MPAVLLGLLLFLPAPPDGPAVQDTSDAYQRLREHMVTEQIAARGVAAPGVLRALRSVPRHRFAPDHPPALAYADRPLPIGHGQTISQPYIVARMTAVVRPDPADRVLEVGTGSGYQAAVLSTMADSVFTIEIIPELADSARARLRRLGYDNVVVRTGDGFHGWPAKAPFDAIVVTAAPERVPPPLLDQLADGGRMVIPVGPAGDTQRLLLLTKTDGTVSRRPLAPVRFVPFLREGN